MRDTIARIRDAAPILDRLASLLLDPSSEYALGGPTCSYLGCAKPDSVASLPDEAGSEKGLE